MNTVTKKYFLKLFPFFRDASPSLVESILSLSRYSKLPSNKIVKFEGDKCWDFVFMLAGEKRIYIVGDSTREITLYEIGAGDICVLNALSILTDSKLSANAATYSESEVLLLPTPNFLDLVGKYDAMRTFVHNHINESIVNIMSLISEITFRKMDIRLLDYLIEKSENKRLEKTHQQIAYDLGTSREVISRLLKEFERQGRLSLSRNLINLSRLDIDPETN